LWFLTTANKKQNSRKAEDSLDNATKELSLLQDVSGLFYFAL
jgi:hypothetical protein